MRRKECWVNIVDDEEIVLLLLSRILEAAGFKVRRFHSGEDFLQSDYTATAACLLLDVQMPGLDGLQIQEQLTARGHDLPIIFLTSHASVPVSVQGLKAGAFDFLTKPCDGKILVEAVRRATAEGINRFIHRTERTAIFAKISTLTAREYEVLLLLITGKLNKHIAASLAITERTVKAHRGSIMNKMGVDSLAEVIWMVEKCGIRPPSDKPLAS